MQLGLTWPLQRLLKVSVPYGDPIDRGLCWDAHCITLHGRSSLLLVHCASRYTCVRYDLSPMDWNRLSELVLEEIKQGLLPGFARLHLAAHKLPQQASCFMGGALAGQKTVFVPNQGGDYFCHLVCSLS